MKALYFCLNEISYMGFFIPQNPNSVVLICMNEIASAFVMLILPEEYLEKCAVMLRKWVIHGSIVHYFGS